MLSTNLLSWTHSLTMAPSYLAPRPRWRHRQWVMWISQIFLDDNQNSSSRDLSSRRVQLWKDSLTIYHPRLSVFRTLWEGHLIPWVVRRFSPRRRRFRLLFEVVIPCRESPPPGQPTHPARRTGRRAGDLPPTLAVCLAGDHRLPISSLSHNRRSFNPLPVQGHPSALVHNSRQMLPTLRRTYRHV